MSTMKEALLDLIDACVTQHGAGWRCICGAAHVSRERISRGHWHEAGCAVAAAVDAAGAAFAAGTKEDA